MSMIAQESTPGPASNFSEISEAVLLEWSEELDRFFAQTRKRLRDLAIGPPTAEPSVVATSPELSSRPEESPSESQEDAMLRLQEIRERLAARLHGG